MKKCHHNWIKIGKPIREYIDYSGFRVGVFRCKCKICGKYEIIKFY